METPSSPVPELDILQRPDSIAALLDPSRRRLVHALAERPDSAVGLARRLDDTRQRLNYHLRQLEEAGLVELVEERPRRGVKERIYRVRARRFVVDPAALGALAPSEPVQGDAFSAHYLVALAARLIRELAELGHRARSTGRRLPTAGASAEVRLGSPADFEPFVDELTEAIACVVARYHTPRSKGRTFRVMAGTWPTLENEPAPTPEEAP